MTVNLDNDPEIEVVDLTNLLRSTSLSWQVKSEIEEWIDNPEIPTPKPALKVNGRWHWIPTQENRNAFVNLWAIHEWLEAELSNRALEVVTITADVLLDQLLVFAKNIERRNSRAYKNNRGNSLQDARRRLSELDGAIQFVADVCQHLKITIPIHKSRLINKSRTEAVRVI